MGFCDYRSVSNFINELRLSVFPANRGVLRRISSPLNTSNSSTFSIPCESWGSATLHVLRYTRVFSDFQYSLRIVGFCDITWSWTCRPAAWLSVFPANRGVLRRTTLTQPRLRISSRFQYSLRIVGFCDFALHHGGVRSLKLSVFPANRGVLRRRTRSTSSPASYCLSVFPANRGVLRRPRDSDARAVRNTFSIPCESWGSATFEPTLVFFLEFDLSVFPANRGVLRPLWVSHRS